MYWVLYKKFIKITFCLLLVTARTGVAQLLQEKNGSTDFTFHKTTLASKGRISFSAKVGRYYAIFVLDLETGRTYPLVKNKTNNTYPTWSADGRTLVFTSATSHARKKLKQIRWNGDALAPIVWQKKNIGYDYPSLSHQQGQNVLFSAAPSDKQSNIFLGSLSGNTPPKRLSSFTGRNITPRLSANKELLVYGTDRLWPGWELCLLNLVTQQHSCPLTGTESFCRPDWHKDNERFLFSWGSGKNIDIALYNLATDTKERITTLQSREYDAAWSPDYKTFIFVADHGKENHFQLYVQSLEDKEPHLLLESTYSLRYLSWTHTSTFKLEAEHVRAKEKLFSNRK